ncbi:hypothetical protein HMPREF1544_00716 [Mucor circinelloides 1006PhL]|uniref:Methyltransferase type 12 domain-containing protein n=1 Tax=Mucor circinelloides f. circinelloides (strain 1006PhL) TaxID=1220926 RepID=S2KAF4_MUCC1|nr:hypothetical protein HMPREF1544_00716 [Mucor circinelloides 1006PhL]
MANVEKIRYILNEPFTGFLKNLLHENFYSGSPDKVVKLLEVGCGPGDFALILKDTLKDKIEITAIDPSDDIEQALKKSTGSDVHFLREDIFTFKPDQRFDLVLFSKSLHHCNPVDQALKNAHALLADNGVLIAEEIQFEIMNNDDIAWFLNRIDLIRAGGHFLSLEERLATAGPTQKPMITRILDSSLPISQRWFRPHAHGSKSEQDGEHHHHHHHSHEHEHHHHHHENLDAEEQKKLDREDPDKIASSNAIRIAIDAQFGKDNIQLDFVPFFYQFFIHFGLKTDEACQAILRETLKQEQAAIKEHKLHPFGLNIIAVKKN